MKIENARTVSYQPLAGMTLAVFLAFASGCSTIQPTNPPGAQELPPIGPMTLASGDELEISFMGVPEMNGLQTIRRDGCISLPMVGDVLAAGKTVEALKKTITDLYTRDMRVQVVTIVVRSQASVFLSGAVRTPGRVQVRRPLTAIEAVMEAGGFDLDAADLQHVIVIRHTESGRMTFTLDLGAVLAGKDVKSFYLEPNDIVHVPKRKPWF